MNGTEGGGGGAETVDEAMDVAVTAPLGNLIVTPGGTSTLLPATDTQAQDAHTPADVPLGAGCSAEDGGNSQATEMEVSTTTTQLQNISVTPSDPCNAAPSAEQEAQPGGDCIALKPAELHQETVLKAEDDSEDSDSDSSSSSSSSSSTPPSVSGHLSGNDEDDEGFSQPAPIKCRDEVLLEELPAVEDVNVVLPEEAELQPVGTISSVLQQLVVVQSLKDTPALTEESILFRSDRLALAKVFEVFGPVSSPLYILRFNSEEQIRSRGLTEGMTVYCAPALKEFTSYILVQQLKLLRGSDASWKNDQEPPPEALDFSDDEQEQDAKRKLKNSRRKAGDDTNNPDPVTQKPLQQQQQQQQQQRRHARPPFRRNKHPQHYAAPPPHPSHPPPPVFLPPPLPPPPFPHYPPPSFYNQPFSGPYWSPNTFPHLLLPPPPPPPPPPQ